MMADSSVRIVAAALRVKDLIYFVERPGRHHTAFYAASRNGADIPHAEQGFITSNGQFVDRETARRIAKHSGQLTGDGHNPRELFSEDLW